MIRIIFHRNAQICDRYTSETSHVSLGVSSSDHVQAQLHGFKSRELKLSPKILDAVHQSMFTCRWSTDKIDHVIQNVFLVCESSSAKFPSRSPVASASQINLRSSCLLAVKVASIVNLIPLCAIELTCVLVQAQSDTKLSTTVCLVSMGLQRAIAPQGAGILGCARSVRAETSQQVNSIDVTRRLAPCIPVTTEPELLWDDAKWLAPRLMRMSHILKSVTEAITFSAVGSHVISGGTGGLGLLTSRWLAQRGAHAVTLLSRGSVISSCLRSEWHQLSAVDAMYAVVAHCNVAERVDIQRVVASLHKRPSAPLTGVWHAAGVLADAMISKQGMQLLAVAYAVKAHGAWAWQQLCASISLKESVLFSSMAALLGGAGQTNYSEANACLDALAIYRRQGGGSAVSIQWAAWADLGMASNGMVSRRMAAKEAVSGLGRVRLPEGLCTLHYATFSAASPCFALIPGRWLEKLGTGATPLLSALAGHHVSNNCSCFQRESSQPLENYNISLDAVIEMIRHTTGAAAGAVGADASLMESGIDSLGANELRSELQRAVGTELPSTIVFDHPTARMLALSAASKYAACCAPRASTSGPRGVSHGHMSLDAVIEMVRHTTGAAAGAVGADASLMESGIDSLGANELRSELQRAVGTELPSTIVFDHPTARMLVKSIADAQSKNDIVARDSHEKMASSAFETPGNVSTEEVSNGYLLWGDGRDEQCVLWYYKGKGRGECIRLALSEAGISFVNRFAPDDRAGLSTFLRHCRVLGGNATTNIPMLTCKGAHFTQTNAILRKIGRLSNLYPMGHQNYIDYLLECATDLREAAYKVAMSGFGPQGPGNLEITRDFVLHILPPHLKNFERLIPLNEYACGSIFTIADLLIYDVLSNFVEAMIPTSLLYFPSLYQYVQRVSARPRIAAGSSQILAKIWLLLLPRSETLSFSIWRNWPQQALKAVTWHDCESCVCMVAVLTQTSWRISSGI